MTRLLAIDPGSRESAFLVLVDGVPGDHGKIPNEQLRANLRGLGRAWSEAVIEFMSPRGLPTSREEMETLWWAGRFAEALQPLEAQRVTRDAVKYHLVGRRNKVTDTNIRQVLIDRFGGIGGKAEAIGTKKAPGPLYGISADVWAALAVAIAWQEGAR